jgi:hypothetical protein
MPNVPTTFLGSWATLLVLQDSACVCNAGHITDVIVIHMYIVGGTHSVLVYIVPCRVSWPLLCPPFASMFPTTDKYSPGIPFTDRTCLVLRWAGMVQMSLLFLEFC